MSETKSGDIDHVQNNPEASRFETNAGGLLSVAEYRLGPGTVAFTHTRVPESLSGRGIATRLIEAGLTMARARHLRVIPHCSFVAAYMRKHPEVQDLLASDGQK